MWPTSERHDRDAPDCFNWKNLTPLDRKLNSDKGAKVDRAALKAQENLVREFLARTPFAKQTFNLDDLTLGVEEATDDVPDSEENSEPFSRDLTQDTEEKAEEVVGDSQDGSDWDPMELTQELAEVERIVPDSEPESELED